MNDLAHGGSAGSARGDRPEPSSPFGAPGGVGRLLPFVAVAVVAQLSVLLPPGPQSTPGLVVSVALLCAVGAAFWLPWARLPLWTHVLVPLAYTGSLLALVLSTGESASGVGIVVLVPLVWTALFHRRWESVCVVVAAVAVEVVTSLVPVQVTLAVLGRRVVFWGVLGVLVSVAIHGLRSRAARARREADELHRRLERLAVQEDRERIAGELYDSTLHHLMSVGLALDATITVAGQPEVRDRIGDASRTLDDIVRRLRVAIFDLDAAAAPRTAEPIPPVMPPPESPLSPAPPSWAEEASNFAG